MPSRVTPLDDIVDLGTDGQQHLKELSVHRLEQLLIPKEGRWSATEAATTGVQQQPQQRLGKHLPAGRRPAQHTGMRPAIRVHLLPMTPSAPHADLPTPLTIWLPGWSAHKERTP